MMIKGASYQGCKRVLSALRTRWVWHLAWLAIATVPALRGAEVPVKLTGIVRIEDKPAALLEIEMVEPGRSTLLEPILRAGERAGTVELLNIHQEDGSVVLAVSGVKETLHLYTNQAPANGTLNLRQAKLEQVLELYQQLAYQTVIRAPLISFRIDLQSEPNISTVQAVQLLEKVFSENGLIVEHRGKFAFVVPGSEIKALLAIPNPPEPGVAAPGTPAPEVFPPGLIKFHETDLQQVVDFYGELSDKNMLIAPGQASKVTVRSQTAMERAEAEWLLETLLRLQGIATVAAGGKFTFVVPAERAKKLPQYDEKALTAKAEPKSGMIQLKFDDAPLSTVLGFYAELTGRKALPLPAGIHVPIFFRARKPLTGPECIFALEALAELNNVRFKFVGDKEVAVELAK